FKLKSHLVALDAIFGFEGILAVVAGAAGFTTLIHVAHLGLERTGLEGEDLGVAVGTFVHAQVEIMAEGCITCLGLEENVARLVPLVALVALSGCGEGVLAVVAGAARFALLHTRHGRLGGAGLVLEYFGVTVRALEHPDMDLVAEYRICYTFELAGDDLAVMAASAGKPCLGNVRIMAESDFRSTFHFEGYSSRLPFMTSGAELLVLDAERLHSGMAGTAGFGRL